jgi:hypothetical protein
MGERLIFVSCGQITKEEKKLGGTIKSLIDSTQGFKAYFAEYVQSLDSLTHNIFDGLHNCFGFIGILHERGKVVNSNGSDFGYRSSVWVNQEIAILSYRAYSESINVPILVFRDPKVKLEGAMTSQIINPIIMVSEADTLDKIKGWLTSIDSIPLNISDQSLFISKWSRITEPIKMVLKALIDEGGINVKEHNIRLYLIDRFSIEKNAATNLVREARHVFASTDLVKLIPNINTGDELSLNPTWKWQILKEMRDFKKALE